MSNETPIKKPRKKQQIEQKKYTLVYSMGLLDNGKEDIYKMEADYWMEDMLAGGSIIFAGDTTTNSSLTIPFTALKGLYQNFGVKEDIEAFAKLSEQMKRRKELMLTQIKKEKNSDVDVT